MIVASFVLRVSGSAPGWVSTLRKAIKQQYGFGWHVREKAGKVQLTRRFDDGLRSSVTLDVVRPSSVCD